MNPRNFINRYLILANVLLPLVTMGQDVNFTQFYANKINVNPAFVGSTEEARAGLMHRSQWSSVPGAYTSQYVFADYSYLSKHGLGVSVMKDQSGGSLLSMTTFNGIYSYELSLNESIKVKSGAALGVGQKRLAIDKLVFEEDQSFNLDIKGSKSFFDLSVGAVIYSDNYWIGVSGNHLAKSSLSFIEGNEFILSPLYSGTAGARMKIYTAYSSQKESLYIYPLLNYKIQGPFKMAELGMFTSISTIIFGTQYRMSDKTESISGIVGLKIEGLQFNYSYDHTLSNLQSYTGGSHEVSMIYEFGIMNKWASEKKKYPWL